MDLKYEYFTEVGIAVASLGFVYLYSYSVT